MPNFNKSRTDIFNLAFGMSRSKNFLDKEFIFMTTIPF